MNAADTKVLDAALMASVKIVHEGELHSRLVARQSEAELERKWQKAKGRHSNHYWIQEWLDVIDRQAAKFISYFNSGNQ